MCITLALHAEYLLRKAHFVYWTGILGIFAAVCVVAVPGDVIGHPVVAVSASVLIFFHVLVRGAFWVCSILKRIGLIFFFQVIISSVFGSLVLVFWLIVSNNFWFSLFQVLMGATLFASLVIHFIVFYYSSI